MNLANTSEHHAFNIYFINKFNWFDASPMATVSTLSTYNIASQNVPTTLIIEGNPSTDANGVLTKKFGLKPNPNYKVKLFERMQKRKKKSTGEFYRNACKYIVNDKVSGNKVVITRNSTCLPYLVALKARYGFIVLFETHGYHGIKTLPDLPKRRFAKWQHKHSGYRYVERLCLNLCDGLVCITKPQERLYKADYVNIPTVVLQLASKNSGHMIDETVIQKRFEQKRVVYIGRLTDHIDAELMIRAAKTLADKGIVFTWLGLKPGDIKKLQLKIEDMGAPKKAFELIAWMPHNDMIKFLSEKATIGLAAYKPTYRSAVVTCPTKIFDYYAVGLPVIGTNIPTVQDILKHQREGLLFDAEDEGAFANAILKILNDYNAYLKMHKAAMNAAAYFSWQNRAKRLLKFVQALNP